MEYRQLGNSGLRVSAVTLGTMGFGGTAWASPVGHIDVEGARRQIGLCPRRRRQPVDTADVYSDGRSEEIWARRSAAGAMTCWSRPRCASRWATGPNDAGLSRHHIIRAARRACAACAPTTSTSTRCTNGTARPRSRRRSSALDTLVRSGKVRYVGCSNYSAWHLMKALAVSERTGLPRFVSQQIYYSLQDRDAESRAGARSRSTRASASWSGARWPAGCSRASTAAAGPKGPRAAGI